MKKILVLCLAAAGVMLANAKSYSMDLYDTVIAGKTELHAGKYRVEVVDQKVVITRGDVRAESSVTVATVDKRYPTTLVLVSHEGGKAKIQEIRLGGTKTKLVLSE